MKSKAQIRSHPIHPILVAFPIAFLTACVLLDIYNLFFPLTLLNTLSIFLLSGGIITGLIAAVPGLIDYLFTVPPGSSAKKRATKHAIVNVTAIVVFSIALYLKISINNNYVITVLIEILGLTLMSIGGWLGGTLVYRNQIGVDIRYAHAGKWKEEKINEPIENPIVARADELKTNQMKLVHINGKRIVLARIKNGYVAFDDHCTHRGGSLASGALICDTVQCPWHGSQFNVTNGEVIAGPAKDKIKTYTVLEKDGFVRLDMNEM